MSLRFASEHRADPALLALEDEAVASGSTARLLITASTPQGVETVARRVHGSGPRAQLPFVHVCAGELPVEPDALKVYCTGLRAAAAGGSLFLSAIEEMPPAVQKALIDLLAAPEFAPGTCANVRLITGTTVSLVDRVVAGDFSDRLFYRLNIIHVRSDDARA
jgi:DNA-binding NtrC family response regulator